MRPLLTRSTHPIFQRETQTVVAVRPTLSTLAPAKINLCLEVLGRRDDGYHEIDTLMVPLAWGDSLAIRPRDDDALHLHVDWRALDMPTPRLAAEDNLVIRALEKIRPAGAGADVWLIKRVPPEAGLGGGSSDAAAALRLGNRLWNLRLSDARLKVLAAELGSDVPFFLEESAARATGRGERLQVVDGLGSLHLVIVKPPQGLSTAEVFRHADLGGRAPKLESVIDRLQRGDVTAAGGLLANTLQSAAETLCDAVGRTCYELRRSGGVGHLMTGSGSACFVLCRNQQEARGIAGRARSLRLGQVWTTRSVA